jgi:G3E family GTPase
MAEVAVPLPATLIAGFGAAGKAQVIAALLRQKPAGEEWAVITPTGAAGPAPEMPGVWLEPVAPGCPCCTGLTPFSAGLTRLLRRLRGSAVTRLLIEGGPEGHIAGVARLLAGEALAPYVVLARSVAVINPLWIANPAAFAHAALRQLAGEADRLIASPWDPADAPGHAAFADFAASFDPAKPWLAAATVVPEFVFGSRSR